MPEHEQFEELCALAASGQITSEGWEVLQEHLRVLSFLQPKRWVTLAGSVQTLWPNSLRLCRRAYGGNEVPISGAGAASGREAELLPCAVGSEDRLEGSLRCALRVHCSRDSADFRRNVFEDRMEAPTSKGEWAAQGIMQKATGDSKPIPLSPPIPRKTSRLLLRHLRRNEMHSRKDSMRRRRGKLNLKPAEQNSNRNWMQRANSWWRHNLISRQELFDWHRSKARSMRHAQSSSHRKSVSHPLRANRQSQPTIALRKG